MKKKIFSGTLLLGAVLGSFAVAGQGPSREAKVNASKPTPLEAPSSDPKPGSFSKQFGPRLIQTRKFQLAPSKVKFSQEGVFIPKSTQGLSELARKFALLGFKVEEQDQEYLIVFPIAGWKREQHSVYNLDMKHYWICDPNDVPRVDIVEKVSPHDEWVITHFLTEAEGKRERAEKISRDQENEKQDKIATELRSLQMAEIKKDRAERADKQARFALMVVRDMSSYSRSGYYRKGAPQNLFAKEGFFPSLESAEKAKAFLEKEGDFYTNYFVLDCEDEKAPSLLLRAESIQFGNEDWWQKHLVGGDGGDHYGQEEDDSF